MVSPDSARSSIDSPQSHNAFREEEAGRQAKLYDLMVCWKSVMHQHTRLTASPYKKHAESENSKIISLQSNATV